MKRATIDLTKKGRKTGILLCLIVSIILPSLILAQTAKTPGPARSSASDRPPGKNAYIVSFHIETEGSLHIVYSDGAEVEVPKERGRFAEGEHILTQDTFSDIQLAGDHQHIGEFLNYSLSSGFKPVSF